jgi:cell division protein FtsL
MASDSELPTWAEIEGHALRHLHSARNEMSEVRDWLNSDWRPLGSPLTSSAADARSEVLRIAGQAKDLIDQAKGLIHATREGNGGG